MYLYHKENIKWFAYLEDLESGRMESLADGLSCSCVNTKPFSFV